MLRHERSAPIWLFSFVDLAFLLLIAFTQIGPEFNASALDIGQLEIPRIESAAAPFEGAEANPAWQLRVHPVDPTAVADGAHAPFELLEPGRIPTAAREEASPLARIDADELAAHLELLRQRRQDKPLLAPHRDSRSEDLLVAVGLLEQAWQSQRTVAVVPGTPVAASPEQEAPARQ